MLAIQGRAVRNCSGVSRREFLRAGALGAAGFSLADLLAAEARAGIRSSHKAVINVHLDGGPPHLDMIDLKPDAPLQVRGEFKPISTAIPGFSICELMPRLAQSAGKVAFIRSLVGSEGAHNAFQVQSGYDEKSLAAIGGRPAMGSVIAKLQGSPSDPVPPFVDLMQGRPLVRNSARPGFLGRAYGPLRPDISSMFSRTLEPGMENELKALGADHATKLTLPVGLTPARLHDRVALQSSLDQFKRAMDSTGAMESMDAFTRQAVEILTSGKLADALDLSREDPRSLARYTLDDPKLQTAIGHGESADSVKKFLLARRLVQAGVRCVSLSLSDYDTHSNNFPRMRQALPVLDHGLATLIDDLDERGMLEDVSIVVWGEFGRTPMINAKAGGRDHWPRVAPAMLAGGGIRAGQVIGSTDRLGGSAASRPVHVQEVFATLYHNLGIDTATTYLTDPTNRPQHIIDCGVPIRELI